MARPGRGHYSTAHSKTGSKSLMPCALDLPHRIAAAFSLQPSSAQSTLPNAAMLAAMNREDLQPFAQSFTDRIEETNVVARSPRARRGVQPFVRQG